MQPLGRSKNRRPTGKHHVKENGKTIPAWWWDEIPACKRSHRQATKRMINTELQQQ